MNVNFRININGPDIFVDLSFASCSLSDDAIEFLDRSFVGEKKTTKKNLPATKISETSRSLADAIQRYKMFSGPLSDLSETINEFLSEIL